MSVATRISIQEKCIQGGVSSISLATLRGSSYVLDSEIESASQKQSQRCAVGVPDLCGNLFDTCVAGLLEMHRAFYAQTLEVRQWRPSKDAM